MCENTCNHNMYSTMLPHMYSTMLRTARTSVKSHGVGGRPPKILLVEAENFPRPEPAHVNPLPHQRSARAILLGVARELYSIPRLQ